jgi:hypothetical protein
MTVTIPHDEMGHPDLQELVRSRGAQYAASIGETYDPAHHGGYRHVTAADWRAWDTAITKWRQDCRDRLCLELEAGKRRHHQLRRYRGKERRAGATQRS